MGEEGGRRGGFCGYSAYQYSMLCEFVTPKENLAPTNTHSGQHFRPKMSQYPTLAVQSFYDCRFSPFFPPSPNLFFIHHSNAMVRFSPPFGKRHRIGHRSIPSLKPMSDFGKKGLICILSVIDSLSEISEILRDIGGKFPRLNLFSSKKPDYPAHVPREIKTR